MYFDYPHGNGQQMNLDWLLKEWFKLKNSFQDMIAAKWSELASYSLNDLVVYENELYYCNTASATVGTFVATEWTVTNIADVISNL